MSIKELKRQHKKNGQTVVEFDAGKLIVRLVSTYDKQKTLDDLIYVMACRRLADKMA